MTRSDTPTQAPVQRSFSARVRKAMFLCAVLNALAIAIFVVGLGRVDLVTAGAIWVASTIISYLFWRPRR